jgi:hypothetical protein
MTSKVSARAASTACLDHFCGRAMPNRRAVREPAVCAVESAPARLSGLRPCERPKPQGIEAPPNSAVCGLPSRRAAEGPVETRQGP